MTTPTPQPSGVSLLGNIFDIDPSRTWESLKTVAEKYGETVCQTPAIASRSSSWRGPALAEELCDEKRFRNFVGGPIIGIRYGVGDCLFAAFDHEESWGVAHRIIAPRLCRDAVAGMFDEMRDTTMELIAKWRSIGPGANRVSTIGELNRLNLEAMEEAPSEAMKRPTRPGFLNWPLYGGKLKRATSTMRAYAAEAARHRKENPSEHRDLFWALLKAKDPGTGKSLGESQVIDEVVAMPTCSSTAPCLPSQVIHSLMENPHVITNARGELDTVVGGEGSPLSRCRVRAVAATTASPVLPGGGKYAVARDRAIIIVLAAINRDPAVFSDPLAFDLGHMTGEVFERLLHGVRRYFGNGNSGEVDFEKADPAYELKRDGRFNMRPVDFYAKSPSEFALIRRGCAGERRS
ncbi:hypothetical protein DL766_004113 [Monosporascus sp. MC13-8B]|uniref:Cytochrome P450 n=1 Tax=Monosporascus cannonballus TaxID=155416 RepID=A0ABY0HIA8_9PEZI|nr:hypothetical protein DL762_000806 [Monosporascus cannonballus]RYO96375.1 hypothetical protein DL763_003231 [Monosporascus cannonballus]RYP32106.1 hypothetical protein DL766_004113 [Monosporascus sp. MC13-8B]